MRSSPSTSRIFPINSRSSLSTNRLTARCWHRRRPGATIRIRVALVRVRSGRPPIRTAAASRCRRATDSRITGHTKGPSITCLSVGNNALCAAISPAAALIHPETDGRLLVRPQSRRRFLFWPKGPFWVGGGGGGYSSRLSGIEAEPPRLARSNQKFRQGAGLAPCPRKPAGPGSGKPRATVWISCRPGPARRPRRAGSIGRPSSRRSWRCAARWRSAAPRRARHRALPKARSPQATR